MTTLGTLRWEFTDPKLAYQLEKPAMNITEQDVIAWLREQTSAVGKFGPAETVRYQFEGDDHYWSIHCRHQVSFGSTLSETVERCAKELTDDAARKIAAMRKDAAKTLSEAAELERAATGLFVDPS